MDAELNVSDRLLSRREVARLLKVAEGTLAHWAAAGTGPAFARSGPIRGRCWYLEADVHAWVQSRRQACGIAGEFRRAAGVGRVSGAASNENQGF